MANSVVSTRSGYWKSRRDEIICGEKMVGKNKKGYSPPKVNRSEVSRLKDLYRRKHPEEFPNLKSSLPKGYPANAPKNLPPS